MPQIAYSRESSAAAAARLCQPAVLKVVGGGVAPAVAVMIAGRLRHVETTAYGPRLIDLILLEPARVDIEFGHQPAVRVTSIDLDDFTAAAPDPLLAFDSRAVEHTDGSHAAELRSYVSKRFGMPETAIAGAMLASLDGLGAELRWVDAVGAHSCEIRFDEPATDAAMLARVLRDHLDPGSIVPLGDQ